MARNYARISFREDHLLREVNKQTNPRGIVDVEGQNFERISKQNRGCFVETELLRNITWSLDAFRPIADHRYG